MKEVQFGKRTKAYRDGLTFKVDDDVDLEGYSFRLHRGYVLFSGIKFNSKYLHRWIMGFPEGFEIDHINRDKLDNRRCNLRVCSRQENNFNRDKQSNNTSGYKGVSFNKQKNKYTTQYRYNRKDTHIGTFNTAEEAYEAYCKKTREIHGDFFFMGKVAPQ